jgi:sterol desaturase/sphingolipid hydroxylase (fatty acid hydroxylase superfamily)
MEWMATIGWAWLGTLAWMAGLALAFGILVRLMPCNPGMYWWRDLRAVVTDFVYWLVVPVFLRIARTVLLLLGVAILFGGREPDLLPVRALPLWQQCLAVLVVQDFMLYWIHRAFHCRLGWQFHAVHHSPKVLDWMSTARGHPINNLLAFTLTDVAVLLLGFAPEALVLLVPFNILYSSMVHANLRWTFGPLKYLFASPVFHRWHHTTLAEGLDRNFASTFPLLDVIFGTFYMPPGKRPEHFGTDDPDFPEGIWGQLIYPFVNPQAQPANPFERAVNWARRRPVTSVVSAGMLAAAGIVAGLYFHTPRARAKVALPEKAEQSSVQRGMGARPRRPRPKASGQVSPVLAVACTPDGQRIFWGAQDGTVKVWDLRSGNEPFIRRQHTRAVGSVAISADGKHFVTGSQDGSVKVWQARTAEVRLTLSGHTSFVLGVAVSADGNRIVSATADGVVKLWDGRTGQERITLRNQPCAVTGVAISADGNRVVWASGNAATLWDAEAGKVRCTLEGHTDLVYSVAISPDGQWVASGSFDRTVKVWDAQTGQEKRTLVGHAGPVYSVAISDQGRVVSGSQDCTIKVWGPGTADANGTCHGHTADVTSVAVGTDGRIVSASRDGTVRVWQGSEVEEGTKKAALPAGLPHSPAASVIGR